MKHTISLITVQQTLKKETSIKTKRPASADRTARRQFQATGQPVCRTQASDATTSRLPRYEAKCVQLRYFQWGSVPLRSDINGTELPLSIYWYHSKGNWLRYNFAADSLYITRMWANAQLNGRPAKHRWRPLFNAAKFAWRPLLDAVQ